MNTSLITRITTRGLHRFRNLSLMLLLTTGILANWQTVSYAEWSANVPNPIMEYHYTYDNNGNITNIYNTVTVSTSTFTYDEVARLTQATGPYGVNNAQVTQTYSYDAVGNTVDITPPVTNTYNNGNIIDYNGKHIDYDYENRPVKITDTNLNTVTEFAYDYSGQRVYTKVSSGTITSEDYYVGNIYEESYSVESSSPIVLASTTTYVYVGSTRVAGLVNQTTATGIENNTYYYHGDHLGSSSIITDGSGTVIRNMSYQPWGNKQENTKPNGIDTVYDPKHKFTGQILDDSTGLYYYGARYYDLTLRRFITPDTIVQSPYDPQSLNRYAYCRNNPLRLIDPTGHEWGYAETGGEYDWFRTTDYFSSDLNNPLNLLANFSGFTGNLFSNALGYTNAGINWAENKVIVDWLGGTVTDVEAFNAATMYFGATGQLAAFGQSLKASVTYTKALIGTELSGEGYLANEMGSVKLLGESSNTGKSLSVLRRTGEGEEFVRFESGNPNFTRVTSEGGVRSGTFATEKTAQSLNVGELNVNFNLPDPNIARTEMFMIKPNAGTWIEGPRPVIYGTNYEVVFPFGTGPKTVVGPFKTKP